MAKLLKSQSGKSTTLRRLSPYHRKRDVTASGEPAGRARAASKTTARQFVIQKHDATRLHYDFRLEMDGVLRSWAVPKGVPMEPGQRNLAVEVEDHPIEYGSFEGVIPEGNYGAGTVMLWDRGTYTVEDERPEDAYRAGKIGLRLAGEKCVGEWTLVRMRRRRGEKRDNWLLLKSGGDAGPRRAVAARDRSVSTGRTLEEIAGGGKPPARRRATAARPKEAARKKKEPRSVTEPAVVAPAEFVPPMKALSVASLPPGDWRLEIKLDGYRAIVVINEGRVELWSRNRKPLTADYPEIVSALSAVPCRNAVLDGEIVALDAEGRSRFQLLQGRDLPGARSAIYFYAFDVIHLDGRRLTDLPLEQRREVLQRLLRADSPVARVSPIFDVSADVLLQEVRRQGLEGIIAKAAGSRYEPDRRSGAWLKCKVMGEQEFVIGGFTPPKNSRPYFGAILVGYFEGGELRYAGKVGSGFDRARLAKLHAEFMRRRIDRPPFADLPKGARSRFGAGMTPAAMRHVTWIKPELVAQVRFAEWTNDGLLRQPVFLGLRQDKQAREVVREIGPGEGRANA